ncbi:hypothetical protein [Terriglobus saanensis]|uniref:Uncharacterized protein n=1 Tax=Terriglobus saanensis (strain ATCC BAA-1853 / DSM 23119 / SP1PR4) TaxID=401053 RepID=E8V4C9_TERSS|nr:hypothetical protein [Terriglobus saanensis]ADV83678.1 hypothetical protein AciPR4_2917 [Terriglobus saanensis SP1PR4]
MTIFPGEDGLDVLIWGRWSHGSMRYRHFDDRTCMIATLKNLGLLSSEHARKLEAFVFANHCPIYSSEIEETVLAAHGFLPA